MPRQFSNVVQKAREAVSCSPRKPWPTEAAGSGFKRGEWRERPVRDMGPRGPAGETGVQDTCELPPGPPRAVVVDSLGSTWEGLRQIWIPREKARGVGGRVSPFMSPLTHTHTLPEPPAESSRPRLNPGATGHSGKWDPGLRTQAHPAGAGPPREGTLGPQRGPLARWVARGQPGGRRANGALVPGAARHWLWGANSQKPTRRGCTNIKLCTFVERKHIGQRGLL